MEPKPPRFSQILLEKSQTQKEIHEIETSKSDPSDKLVEEARL